MSKLNFYELARTSHIKRWTIINTTREQNLAEHQYNVTVIALELRKRWMITPPSALFIMAAMFHDSPEIRTGDIPTPGKAFMRGVLEEFEGDFFEHMDRKIMPNVPYDTPASGAGLSDTEKRVLKLADLIEAAWWVRENGAGYHARTVAAKCWRAVEDFVHEHNIYTSVNPVLMDLGLPFVNKSERMTPP